MKLGYYTKKPKTPIWHEFCQKKIKNLCCKGQGKQNCHYFAF